VPGQRQLGIGELEADRVRRAGRQFGEAGVMVAHQRDGPVDAGPHQVTQRLGVPLELLDVRTVGQRIGGHSGLLSSGPGVRTVGQEGDGMECSVTLHQVGFALPADRRRSWIAARHHSLAQILGRRRRPVAAVCASMRAL